MKCNRPCDYNVTVEIPSIYGKDIKLQGKSQVMPLEESVITTEAVVEAIGAPKYVDDIEKYSAYGLTETGWYVFARIIPVKGTVVTGSTTIEGAAGYIAEIGNWYIDVAVRFGVAAVSQVVVIDWGTGNAEKIVFTAPDLATRNLDYLTTFYVYDAAPFVKWEFKHSTDAKFVTDKNYYTKQDGEYVKAEVTLDEDLPEAYYILDSDTQTYLQTDDEVFAAGTIYYIKNETDEYLQASVTVGDRISAYYDHQKVIIEGLPRNVTYRLDGLIDCPMEFILPEIEDETHGVWFEIRCRHAGAYSMTLTPPTSDIKIATEHTQKETKGINRINLDYTVVDGVKIWRFMNTHSSIPA